MKFLDINGLKRFLALLLTKVVAAINEVADKVTIIEGDYLSKNGNAASADKLNTNAGSAAKPVYFSGGKPAACTYELNANVPSGAKFTDTVYTHPNTSGNKHIPSGGKSGQILRWSADGTAQWGADNNTTYTEATQSKAGLMSAEDKKIIDHFRIDSRNNVTTNPTYGNLMVVPGTNDDYNTELASWVLNGENCSVLHYEDKKTASNSTNFIVYHPKTKRVQFPTGVEISNLYSAGELYIRSNATDIWIDFGYDDYNFNTSGATFSHPLHVDGKVTSSGSDYAKYYEWLDENPDNEDRRGLFVTLEGEKIKTANAEDGFILGVVSAAPGFIENAYEKEWQGKYLKDIYGERITQETEVPESTDAEGNTIPATIKTEYVLNPEYNEDEKYIPRSQRSEWTYVGLTGELVVRDDGTCKVNGYCKPTDGGIATAVNEVSGATEYRVLARLDDSHIKILIK